MSAKVYRSKAMQAEVSVPKHGTPGWVQKGDGSLQCVIYCGKSYKWMTESEYRERVAARKLANFQFYAAHPNLLRQKINGTRYIFDHCVRPVTAAVMCY